MDTRIPSLSPYLVPGVDHVTGLPSLAALGRKWGAILIAGVLAEMSTDAFSEGDSIDLLAGVDEEGRAVRADLIASSNEPYAVDVMLRCGDDDNGWSDVDGGGLCDGALRHVGNRRRHAARDLMAAAEFVWELAVRETT